MCPECGVEISVDLIERIHAGKALSVTRYWLFWGLIGWVVIAIHAVILGMILISHKRQRDPFTNVNDELISLAGIAVLLLIPVPVLALWHRRRFSLIYQGAIRRASKRPRVLVRALALGVPGALIGALSAALIVLTILAQTVFSPS